MRREFEALIPGIEKLAPSWMNRIHVIFISNDQDSNPCSTTVHWEYRMMTIQLHTSFFTEEPNKQLEFLRHEMMHVYSAELIRFAKDLVKAAYGSDSDEGRLFNAELERKMEAHVTDLELMLGRIL